MTKKNLNNQLVMEEIIRLFEEAKDSQNNTYEITFMMFEDAENNFNMTCEIFSNDSFMTAFPIGWGYTEKGIYRKANQLMKLIPASYQLEQTIGKKNILKSWGFDRVDYQSYTSETYEEKIMNERLDKMLKTILDELNKLGFENIVEDGIEDYGTDVEMYNFYAGDDHQIAVKYRRKNNMFVVFSNNLSVNKWKVVKGIPLECDNVVVYN